MVTDILIGRSTNGPEHLRLDKANRHGLIAGVTGSGKTRTLQTLAEAFSAKGVPVFAADVKGDLSGIAVSLNERRRAPPVKFWDLYESSGAPIRTTVSSLGPLLLARLLDLNDAQAGVLNIAFHLAKSLHIEICTLADLSTLLRHLVSHRAEIGLKYGSVSPASIGTMLRKVLALSDQGGDIFFGQPAFDIRDLISVDDSKRGVINILVADLLYRSPKLYTTFLFWLLNELFEKLPEVGDLAKPKMVFFFDEASLLFKDLDGPLLEKIDQVVRLIRSKGVGIYFVTQSPTDIPNDVLRQLSNRFQHALRAYTPADQRMVKAAAQSYRPNPQFDTGLVMQSLETGDALVSCLDERGTPGQVELTRIRTPYTKMGALTPMERVNIVC